MRKLFLTIFLWFWLPLLAAAVLLMGIVGHAGVRYRFLVRLALHDLMLFSVTGGIFCYLISRYLTKPLAKLGDAAANIAEGRLDTRVDPSLRNRRDEIADLAHNFDRMAERIEALITGQRRLLGDVSHELRSPLSRLIVALGLVKQGPAEEAAENLERIGLEARRLDTLIGQLLALTRIDSGVDRGSPEPFDLTNVVQEVANDGDFEARARNRGVVIKVGRVHGHRIRRAITKRRGERRAECDPAYGGRNCCRDFNSSQQFVGGPSGAGLRTGGAGKHAVGDLLAVSAGRERQFGRGRARAGDCRTRRECSSRDDPRDECAQRRTDRRDRFAVSIVVRGRIGRSVTIPVQLVR